MEEEKQQQKDEKLDRLLGYYAKVNEEVEHYDTEGAFLKFRKKIALRQNESCDKKSSFISMRRVLSYAAVIIPLLLISWFTYNRSNILPSKEYSVSVPLGSKTQLNLEDGTKVWLNSGSTLAYSTNFGKGKRLVHLSGEAYFEVAKKKKSPFIVKTKALSIQVFGTHFNVSAYKEDPICCVALLEGSVKVAVKKVGHIFLKPEESAIYNTQTNRLLLVKTKSDSAIDWIKGQLVFDGDSFEQIIKTLERTYNVKIQVSDKELLNHHFRGDFSNHETIEQIFSVMASMNKFHYTIKGNVIYVTN